MLRWKDAEREILMVTVTATAKMRALAQEALDVQNAVNIVAVAGAFHRALLEIAHSQQNKVGGNYTCWHPVTRLWIDKLEHLAHMEQSSTNADYMRVADLAEGKDIEFEIVPDVWDLEEWRRQLG